MSEEPLCPFCSVSLTRRDFINENGVNFPVFDCDNFNCMVSLGVCGLEESEAYRVLNTRPVEDALREDSKALQREWYSIANEYNKELKELEQQLAEAKRANLEQRITDMLYNRDSPREIEKVLRFKFPKVLYPRIDMSSIMLRHVGQGGTYNAKGIAHMLIEQGVTG